jgi:hypothetical protein
MDGPSALHTETILGSKFVAAVGAVPISHGYTPYSYPRTISYTFGP